MPYASTNPRKKRTITRPLKSCTREVIPDTKPQIIMQLGRYSDGLTRVMIIFEGIWRAM